MNDLFQERYRAPSIHTITTIYDCKRTFDKCKAALWVAAQPHHAFAKIGVGIRGRKCVCHLHDKADGLNRSERTVKTALNELENAGLITRVRQGWNRANRIFLHLPDGVQLSSPPEGNICPMEVQESSPCMGQKLPTSNTKQEYINLIQTERGEIARRRFGEYQNVFLPDDEFTWLQNAYPDKFGEYINRLSAYMETSGKHYANHYATIRKWLDEDSKPKPGNSYDYDYTYDKGECL